MPRAAKAIVLDSWSVMAYLEDVPAGEKVADLIADAHDNSIPVMMSVVNVGEVWSVLARQVSEAEAEKAVGELQALRVQFVDADWKLTREASAFKSKHRMSFADCFAAALAKREKAQLVTGDAEFRQVEGEVTVNWVAGA